MNYGVHSVTIDTPMQEWTDEGKPIPSVQRMLKYNWEHRKCILSNPAVLIYHMFGFYLICCNK